MKFNKKILDQKIYKYPNYEEFQAKLDLNENFFPRHPSVDKIINMTANQNLHTYPIEGTLFNNLLSEIKKYIDYDTNNILLTNGSDNALKIIAQLCATDDTNILIPIPTYPHFELCLDILPHKQIKKLSINYSDESENIFNKIKLELNAEHFDLCYLVNPNMPIGYSLSIQLLEILVKSFPNTLFIIDEAYYEYGSICSAVQLIKSYENIIVTRTFSKFFAIANLRIGYLVTNKKLYDLLSVIHNFKDVSDIAMRAALVSLQNIDYYKTQLKEFNDVRNFVKKRLAEIVDKKKFIYDYSLRDGSYFLIISKDSKFIKDTLEKKGIYIRDKNNEIKGSNRITIGMFDHMKKLFDCLEEINKNN